MIENDDYYFNLFLEDKSIKFQSLEDFIHFQKEVLNKNGYKDYHKVDIKDQYYNYSYEDMYNEYLCIKRSENYYSYNRCAKYIYMKNFIVYPKEYLKQTKIVESLLVLPQEYEYVLENNILKCYRKQ